MKIQEVMTGKPESCGPEVDLAAAAMIMWRRDCGVVPVVDPQSRVLGVITDRDICMASATRHRRPEDLTARDAISHRLFTVRADDDVRVALELMRNQRVRRLPVVDADRRLVGIVSINDLLQRAEPGASRTAQNLPAQDVLDTMKAIGAHALPVRTPKPTPEPAHAG